MELDVICMEVFYLMALVRQMILFAVDDILDIDNYSMKMNDIV